MRRKLNLSIPGLDKQFKYEGGTQIWFTTLRKQHKLEPFDINKIYSRGTLLIRHYKDAQDQGHLAIIFSNNTKNVLLAKLIHCYPLTAQKLANKKQILELQLMKVLVNHILVGMTKDITHMPVYQKIG